MEKCRTVCHVSCYLTGNVSRTAMTSILETRLEGSLVSNQEKWPHQTAQTVFIDDKFDAVS